MSTEKGGCLGLLRGFSRQNERRASATEEAAPAATSAASPATPAVEHRASAPTFPYKLRTSFLSPAETAFYKALLSAIGSRYVIFAKVRLLDLCADLARGTDQAAFNRIVGKHIDFLLCDPSTFQPIAAVELDDSTHYRPDRTKRDAFVDEVFVVIGLPLVRFRVQLGYDPQELSRRIESSMSKRPKG